MQPHESSTLNALNALVRAGASDQLVALATRELIGKDDGKAEPVSAGLEMAAAQFLTPAPFVAAASVLQTAPVHAPAPTPFSASHPSEARSARDSSVAVHYRKSGLRTTVRISADDWAALLTAFGGDEKELREHTRNQAGLAPPGVKVSRWIIPELYRLASTGVMTA